MLLKDWLEKENITRYRLWKMLGTSRTVVYKILAGTLKVSPSMAIKIEKATNGEVTRAEAMWPDHYKKSPAER